MPRPVPWSGVRYSRNTLSSLFAGPCPQQSVPPFPSPSNHSSNAMSRPADRLDLFVVAYLNIPPVRPLTPDRVTNTKPGSATLPFPGIKAEIKTDRGDSIQGVGGGLLALTRPWPAMLRGIYGDPDRYVKQYWSRWTPDIYFTGDGAKRDQDGFFWLLGRVDDVLNVAGHRIGTMEVESALVDHPRVAEAAVVGRPHEIKGQAVAAFVTLREGAQGSESLVAELKDHVVKKIGAIARPDDVIFSADLPKTRSGKIMRRLLRDIAEGKALGDTTTLADPAVVARLKEQYQDEH